MNTHFIQLLTVNFQTDALVRFQKSVMDNINCRPPDSHHNLQFMQFWFWKMFRCFVKMKPLSWSFMIVVKDPFFIKSHNAIKKWINWVPLKQHQTHLKKSRSLTFTNLSSFFTSLIFLRRSILLKCRHPLPETFLWHFLFNKWFQILIVNFRCLLLTWSLKLLSLLKYFWNQYHIVQSQVDPSLHVLLRLTTVWEALWPSLNSCRKVNTSGFYSCSWLGAYNVQNQILKEVIKN